LEAAKVGALSRGFGAEILAADISGEARDSAQQLAEKAKEQKKARPQGRPPLCLISGGEPTVSVRGNGLGGRNMELALAFAAEIDGSEGITLLSAGTDGTDGPTDAAGAIVDGETIRKAKAAGLDPDAYLANNDSYHFFQKSGGLLITGPTGTNVMDIQLMLIG
jgi:glycerate-2-kinase